MTKSDKTRLKFFLFMVTILLGGAFLRWAQLSAMAAMLNLDEAANGLDALSLIRSPRLTPFFPTYTGRESGWHYWLIPFLLAFGTRPFSIRLAATMAGILTLTAVYILGRELFPRRVALWSAGALAVFYWHVQLSHTGFRAILFPLVGALAMALLLRAYRTNGWAVWVSAGIMLGLLAYTYFSARMWLLLAGLLLLYWGIREPQKRRGILLAGGMTAVLALPPLLYTTLHPDASLGRIGEVSVFSLAGITSNVLAWLRAWFQVGDQNVMLNMPGRPILDWLWGIPFLVGLVGLWWVVKKRGAILLIAGLAIFAVLPSLFSDHAPHFLRAIGLVIPISLIIGAGLYLLENFATRYAGRIGGFLPLVCLLVGGALAYQTLSAQWLRQPALFAQMEVPINEAADFIKANTPAEMPVYYTAVSRLHPTLLFRKEELAPRHVTAFDARQCWVKTAVPAVYVLAAPDQTAQAKALIPLTVTDDYAILSTPPDSPGSQGTEMPTAVFGDALQVSLAAPLPDQVQPGAVITVALDLQALPPVDSDQSLFLHLYGTPSPYEGGRIWTQNDSPLCPSYPMTVWQPFETVNQQFLLSLPPDIPPGAYTLVTGLYNPADGTRLPLTSPTTNQWHHFELAHIEVTVPGE